MNPLGAQNSNSVAQRKRYSNARAYRRGQTYARVGYTTGEFVDNQVFKDSHGNRSIPTCVAFTDAEILVGHGAYHS